MRISDWSSDVCSSDLAEQRRAEAQPDQVLHEQQYRARHRARLGPHQTMHAREGRAIIGRIEDRRYEDQSDSDMPLVDPIAVKKDRSADRHTDRGRGQPKAPVADAETVGQTTGRASCSERECKEE